MMRSKTKTTFDPLELDLQAILRTPTDTKTVLVRVVIVVAAVVVGMLIFDYYMTDRSHVVRFLERHWSGGADNDPDQIETVLDSAGHIKRRIVFQAPRNLAHNIAWNKRRWQEAIADKLPAPQEQQQPQQQP